jgi:CheY-like chemotaxis protein/anti-sigma regulatory factor (Ser/Thr protein kinase)
MPTILVADDVVADRRLVGAILEQDSDLEILYATDGADAIAQVEMANPDLVLTDMRMPNMDGLQLVRAVRERCGSTPIVVMTSHGSEQLAADALAAGAASYVPKSESSSELLDTVRHVLALSTRRQPISPVMAELKQSRTVYVIHNDSHLITSLVSHLQENVGQMGICDESEQIRFGVAVEEALINAMIHGNLEIDSFVKERNLSEFESLVNQRRCEPPYKDRKIEVEIELSPNEAVVTVGDQGTGFDPEILPDPTDPENLEKVSGRGVLLMRSFMDKVEFNRVTMTKHRKSGESD